MRACYGVAEVRAAEQRLMARLPPGTLMQRAAAGLAARCAHQLGRVYGARVVLLVGKGDNGGDALHAGARLARRGAAVAAVLVADTAHPAGLAALRDAGGRVAAGDPAELLGGAQLIVDGMLGIGGRGGLRDRAAELAAAADRVPAPVVAADVPSGVDATTGRVPGAAVRAQLTVTFGAVKTGLVVSPGAEHAGTVELVDIGLAGELPTADTTVLEAADVALRLPVPDAESDKYRRGVVGVLAGSDAYTGAAVLCTGGAVRAGAGMVRYVGVPRAARRVRQAWPDTVVTEVPAGPAGSVADPAAVLAAGRVQAWVVGPGAGTDPDAKRVLAAVLGTDLPVLVDADGLRLLADDPTLLAGRRAPTLLTPHAGEFARLTGDQPAQVAADRLARTRAAAVGTGATVLLKGSTTVVADPAGATRVNPTGTPWLATAGSGDVLSGACATLLAQGLTPLDAGACGAFLHGLAGRAAAAGGAPIRAADLLDHWAAAVRRCRAGLTD